MSIELPYFEIAGVGDFETLSQTIPWQIGQNNINSIWSKSKGEGATVMVLDTGYSDHPDNCNEVKGPSFVTNEPDSIDYNGHGSHVVGIIGACDNSKGIVGVAPKAKVISAKVMDKNGRTLSPYIERALRYALDMKPDVVNISFGSADMLSGNVLHLINKLWEEGIPLICAAGNHGPGKGLYYPAGYPNVIAVGAIDIKRKIAIFSAQGSAIDFAAPGVDILSTYLNQEYATLSGTSQAAPFVTGLVALIVAYNRKLGIKVNNCDYIKDVLKSAAKDVGVSGFDEVYGNGIIDPSKMLKTPIQTPANVDKRSFWQKLFGIFKKN